MTSPPLRIIGCGTAAPAHDYTQAELSAEVCRQLLGADWADRPEVAEDGRRIHSIFAASRVEHRQLAAEVYDYYARERTTGERMADYECLAYPLARDAVLACLDGTGYDPDEITDLIVVSCTGYTAPGLDILLARDLGMPPDVRRLLIGHMGCYGALVGLRSALATLRAQPGAVVAVVCVELSSLHFRHDLTLLDIPGAALFADAAAAVLLATTERGRGPRLVDAFCAADFRTLDQMTWRITDHGFAMGLSRRIPITLRRNVAGVVERLLSAHGLVPADVTHWLVHPGGPDILTAIQDALGLCGEQLALSWQVLRDHGNCSSATVLLVLDRLLRSCRPRRGDWGVMMAFGPGLTLETCLLRF